METPRHHPPADLPVAEQRNPDEIRLTLPEEAQLLDLDALFGNALPVELEIGMGKGRFIMLAAAALPEVNFIGLEYIRKYLEHSLARVAKRNLKNVRLAHAEAFSFLRDRLADDALSGCHIYFPDPWPKKRHHKRRIVRPPVLDQLARVLRSGSLLRIASDHADYARVIRETVTQHAAFEPVTNAPELWTLPTMDDFTASGVTNFEIKYRREGRPIHRFAWRRA